MIDALLHEVAFLKAAVVFLLLTNAMALGVTALMSRMLREHLRKVRP